MRCSRILARGSADRVRRAASPARIARLPAVPLLALLALGLSSTDGHSFDVSGNLSTSFWAYEDTSAHFISYQQLRVRGAIPEVSRLSFQANLRWTEDVSGDTPGGSNTRIYNALLAWRSADGRIGLEAGRKFIGLGVGNGLLDGLAVQLRPARCCRLWLYAGTEAPVPGKTELSSWSERNTYGVQLSHRDRNRSCDISWVRKSRHDQVSWHQAGVNVRRQLGRSLHARVRADYNIAASAVQLLRARVGYEPGATRFWLEGSHQAPRIAEDSFFSRFELSGFSQARLGGRYEVRPRRVLTAECTATFLENDTALRVRLGFEAGIATLGVQIRTSDTGREQTVLFGGIRHSHGPFRGRIGFDASRYKLSEEDEESDQQAAIAEIAWQPAGSPLGARIQAQRLVNRFYEDDYRLFGRLSLDF